MFLALSERKEQKALLFLVVMFLLVGLFILRKLSDYLIQLTIHFRQFILMMQIQFIFRKTTIV
ncbi:MAG: hypothetical protein EBY63_02195 [Flavobacteriia bacterium]|nr:hypothetical protein [Flavobacteriia bacterium]